MVLGYDYINRKYTWTDPKAEPVEMRRHRGIPEWHKWTPCETSGFGAYQPIPNDELLEYAVRTITKQGRYINLSDIPQARCTDLFTTRPRNLDCQGGWTPWSECSNNSQLRTYNVTQERRGTGAECPKAQGDSETKLCAVNCDGQWTPWSNVCVDGRESRTYSIKTEKVSDGTDCPARNNEIQYMSCTGGTTTTTSPAPSTSGTTPPKSSTSGTTPPKSSTSGTTPPKSKTSTTSGTTTTPPPIPWYKKSIIVAGVKISYVWLIGGIGFVFFMFLIILLI
jgi:hypothetical protein